MSTILITRPHPKGAKLCSLLAKHGMSAVHLPLIEFKPKGTMFNLSHRLMQSDIIITISQSAAQYCHLQLEKQSLNWPQTPRYLAIGQKTARLLTKLSQQQVDYPAQGDSEHLLSHPLLKNVNQLNIVILRGNGGREFLAEQLSFRGARVQYCEVYHREFIPFDANIKVVQWQEQNVSDIVITSEEQLCFFLTQLPRQYRHWLFGLRIYVPSTRIAQVANEIGFENTIVVGSANNFDLMAAIQPKVIGRLNDNQQHNARDE